MASCATALKPPPLSPSPSLASSKPPLCVTTINSMKLSFFRCVHPTPSRKQNPGNYLRIGGASTAARASVLDRLQSLDSEFRSLSAPIDRVKRLLLYADRLLPLDESSRSEENRVMGCTAQVWLEVKMDANGLMRFRVYSDSEITKGFCSCLIWVLDGAAPDEVLRVKVEDLAEMNVGLPSRGISRVNPWQNVLISMQKRTRVLVESEAFSSLIVVNESRVCNPV